MTATIGTMRRLDEKHGAVRVEDVYDTDIDDLWSALTEPARLARWIATVDGEPSLGGTVRVSMVSTWAGPTRIDVCDAPTRLHVTLEPGSDDETVVEATLTAEGPKTRLVIEERGLLLDELHHHGAGWQAHAEDLHRHLAGDESRWKTRWDELGPTYKDMPVG